MKKSLAILAAVAILGILAVSTVAKSTKNSNASPVSSVQAQTSASNNSNSPSSSTTPASTSNTSSTKIAYKDGTFTGQSYQNEYGDVQIALHISGGKISSVDVLNYPNDNPHSIRINSQALPLLKQQTLSTQSGTIDGVSGATATTDSYMQSLQSAIDQARINQS